MRFLMVSFLVLSFLDLNEHLYAQQMRKDDPLRALFFDPEKDKEKEEEKDADIGIFSSLEEAQEEESVKTVSREEEHSNNWRISVSREIREIKKDLSEFQEGLSEVRSGLNQLQGEVGNLRKQVGENKISLLRVEELVKDSNSELKNLRKDLRGQKYKITEELVSKWQTKVRHELKGEILAYKVLHEGRERYLDEQGYLISNYLLNGEVGKKESGVVYTNTESGTSAGSTSNIRNYQGGSTPTSYRGGVSTRGSCYIDQYGRRQCR